MHSVARLTLVAILCSCMFGQQAPPLAFEVASIRPTTSNNPRGGSISPAGNRFTMIQEDLGMMIIFAYSIRGERVLGGPNWLRSEKYDLIAKAEGEGARTTDEFRQMLQPLLADRFKLAVHREMREVSGYALVVGKNGPKLREVKDDSPQNVRGGANSYTAQKISMTRLASYLGGTALRGASVFDETGLKGEYAFTLEWNPEESFGPGPANGDPSKSSKPSIFTAVQEQLGLKLESVKRPAEHLIIDHAEKPSGN